MPVDAPCPENALRKFLAEQGIGPDQPVHLAVSGGMDSMALLHAAHAVHSHLIVLHLDHGLRAASADDRAFVEHTAAALGLPVASHRIEGLIQTAADRGEGLEAAARAARYGWFGTQVSAGGVLLTGHHADDQRETRLLHWLRGSRADSWSGMLPLTEERGYAIGRPFLGLSLRDLQQWMVQQGHPWREDDSNGDPAFLRNRIRLELLPLLDDLHPGWEAGMARQASIAAEWSNSTDRILDCLTGPIESLPLTVVHNAPSPRLLLARWAGRWHWPTARLEELLHLVAEGTEVGKQAQSASHRFTRERDALRCSPLDVTADTPSWRGFPDGDDGQIDTPTGTLIWSVVPAGPLDPSDNTAQLHLDDLALPLTLRPWTEGDRIQPLGMDGHQNVSDILNRRGVAHSARSAALMVVQANGCPAWLVGHRIDRRAALPHPEGSRGPVLLLTWQPA